MARYTLREVKDAALRCYEEKRLGAQNGKRQCLYRYPEDDTRCAIGAALNNTDLRNACEHVGGILSLSGYKGILFEDEGITEEIQHAHDIWLKLASRGEIEKAAVAEKRFLSLIKN